jgi:hypothetical protein
MLNIALKQSASPPAAGEASHGSKRICLASAIESTSSIGEIEKVSVPPEIWDLHNSGAYVPVGLFTLESIRTIQDSAPTVKGHKDLIPIGDGTFTTAKIINPNSPGLTPEGTILGGFASKTMILWAKDVKSDEVLYSWLLNHFRWVAAMRTASKIDFPTARAFDIEMRSRYHRSLSSSLPNAGRLN